MPFEFDFTKEKLVKFLPNLSKSDEWHIALAKHLQENKITSLKRVAMFLAQCSHESGGFTVLQENLNYRAERILQVFPKYFKNIDPSGYAHNPEKLANRVYANRMGNGDEASGDGYRFHGRGIIQITGRDNYTNCSFDVWKDRTLIKNPDLLLTIDGAVISACWFWTENNINKPSDNGDVVAVTKIINGGTNGLVERTNLYKKALVIFK